MYFLDLVRLLRCNIDRRNRWFGGERAKTIAGKRAEKSVGKRAGASDVGCLLFLLLTQSLTCYASAHDERGYRQLVVTINAKDSTLRPESSGLPLHYYRLFTYRQGGLAPIPLQIDELDVFGSVYSASLDREMSGQLNIFDGDDQLLFMYLDASTVRWQGISRQGGVALDPTVAAAGSAAEGAEWFQELIIKVPGNDDRYVYLAAAEAWTDHATAKGYLEVDKDARIFTTEYYKLEFPKANPLEVQNLYYHGPRGEGGEEIEHDVVEHQPILDGMKVRVRGGVLAKFAKMTLNNRNVKVKVSEITVGPVRARMQMEARFTILKMPILKIYLQSHFYRNAIMFDSWLKLPGKGVRKLFREPVTEITIDGNNLMGATVEVSGIEGIVGQVDGRMSATELAYMEVPMDPHSNWFRLTTDKFQVVSRFIPPRTSPIKLALIYEDDAVRKDKPERFLGQLPNLGYRVSDINRYDQLDMGFEIVFDSVKTDELLEDYIDNLQTEPTIESGRLIQVR